MTINFCVTEIEKDLVNLNSFTKSLLYLRENSERLRQEYLAAKPYPHLIIDNLFDEEILDRIANEFPTPENRDWLVWDTQHELKTTSKGISGLSTLTQIFCLWLNSADFIAEISKIVGIDDLVGDPVFRGAGLHEMYRNGWLEMHTDYTKHYQLPLMRRLNFLVYLNRDWDPSWGGELAVAELDNLDNMVSYPPYFNRTIIFPTTDQTYHGAPNKLSCPPDRSRKLLSIYYWNPIPAPFLLKAGTPILWASKQQKSVKNFLKQMPLMKNLKKQPSQCYPISTIHEQPLDMIVDTSTKKGIENDPP